MFKLYNYFSDRDKYEKKLGILLDKMSEVIKNADSSHPALLILVYLAKHQQKKYSLMKKKKIDTVLHPNSHFETFIKNTQQSVQKHLADAFEFINTNLQ